MTKIVFMGTPAFSVPILESLIEAGCDVQAVITQPDRPVGRKKAITPTPVKETALRHNLLVLQPEKISGFPEIEKMIDLVPDLIVTAAFGRFLLEKILRAPKLGAVNVHALLLPKYRSSTPVHYSIIEGREGTGVTIVEMMKKMDAGAILSQRAIPITKQDDVGTMFEKLSILGEEPLLEMLSELIAGEITSIPQMEEETTFSPNITREQERIDWQKTAGAIDNRVRDMRSWPTAFTTYQGTNWEIQAVTPLTETTTSTSGTTIQRNKKALWTAYGEGTVLQIDRLQPAGKGQLTIQESLNGVGQNVAEKDKVS